MVQSLYNTELSEKRAIGYCHHHHCYVSVTQLKQKECLKKQCGALEKHDHFGDNANWQKLAKRKRK